MHAEAKYDHHPSLPKVSHKASQWEANGRRKSVAGMVNMVQSRTSSPNKTIRAQLF